MSVQPKIGFLTIGQSPREDVISDIARVLGPEIEIIEKGALDGLSQKDIEKLKPEKNDFPLITRLRDGVAAVVGKRKIIPLLQKQVSTLEESDAKLIALLCTDDFREIKSQKLLLLPYQMLFNAVTTTMKKGKLAVLAPLKKQEKAIREKWRQTDLEIIVEYLNPYQRISKIDPVIKAIADQNVDLIVLDCIGYSSKIKYTIEVATRKPVLLPRSLLATFIKGFLTRAENR